MAFPSVRSSIKTDGTAATATPVVSLPATVGGGDTLFVVFRVAVGGAIGWPAGWNELFDASPEASADDQTAAAWKKADGTEGGTTITLSCTSGKFAAIAYAIRDAQAPEVSPPELSTVATGVSGAPNATTCTPTGGAKDYLWLTFTGREGEAGTSPTYPTNYTVAQLTGTSGTASTVGTNVRVSGAVRTNLNAASEDAGAWTFDDSEDWLAYTVAFHPAEPVPAPLQTSFADPVPAQRPRLAGLAAFAMAAPLALLTYVPPDVTVAPTGSVNWTTSRVVTASKPHVPPTPAQSNLVLAEVPAPFVQTDWPVPARSLAQRTAQIYGWIAEPPAPDPFAGNVHAVPIGTRPTQPPTWTNSPAQEEIVEGEAPFKPLAWTIPDQPQKWRTPSTASREREAGEEPPVAAPFAQTHWPNPQKPQVAAGRLSHIFYYFLDDEPPFAGTAGVVPSRPTPKLPPTWAQSGYRDEVVVAPFSQTNWPNPSQPRLHRAAQTFGWIAEEAEEPPVDEAPFAQRNWPNPQYPISRPGRLTHTSYYIPSTPLSILFVSAIDRMPTVVGPMAVGFANLAPLVLQTVEEAPAPFVQIHWPNPPLGARSISVAIVSGAPTLLQSTLSGNRRRRVFSLG
jgi:hypothetical protein